MTDTANPWNIPWSANVGLELTYISAKEDPHDYAHFRGSDGQLASYSGTAEAMRVLHRGVFDGPEGVLHSDPGCVEWSTPVLRSWAEAREVWEYGHTLASMFDLQEEHSRVAGGMGHIHISVDSPNTAQAILTDLFCRPYIAWAFCHYQAIEYCQPAYVDDWWVPSSFGGLPHTPKFTAVAFHNQPRDSRWGTSKNGHSLEFRMFNMASTWGEQYRNLAFVQQYVRGFKYRAELGFPRPVLSAGQRDCRGYGEDVLRREVHRAYGRNRPRCVRELRQLIDVLGLPWENYQESVCLNLLQQFRDGRGTKHRVESVALDDETSHQVMSVFDPTTL